MIPATDVVLPVVASFVVGSIPFGFLVAKAVKGVDVRKTGSGNVGATNVGRALGRRWFFVVLALDAAKGVVAVLLLARAFGGAGGPWIGVACGTAAVLGHVFSPFLRFRGGKGVATTAGAVGALAPLAGAAALLLFLLVLAVFRYVSLASVCAAAALPVLCWVLASREAAAFAVVVAAVVVVRHRGNLARIGAGTEPRVGARREPAGG